MSMRTHRLGALAGACLLAACADSPPYYSNSYAVAGAFAAVAGALTVAQEVARLGPTPGTCAQATCGGCCDTRQVCRPGSSDTACGAGGDRCYDCTRMDGMCAGGACVDGDGTAAGSAPASPNLPACDVASCPKCALGSPCCSSGGACTCSVGNLCL